MSAHFCFETGTRKRCYWFISPSTSEFTGHTFRRWITQNMETISCFESEFTVHIKNINISEFRNNVQT